MEKCFCLADELVADILSKLPVKSIIRFMCVSKSWRTLISSPYFISSHLRKSLTTDSNDAQILAFEGLAEYNENSVLNSGYSHQNYHFQSMLARLSPHSICKFEIVGCTAGLICFLLHGDHFWRFIIFNPEIGCFRSVPAPDGHCGLYKGFAFDDTTLDYYIFIAHSASYVYIYSLNSDSWRSFPCQDTWFVHHGCNVVFVNGSFYWLTNDHDYVPPRPQHPSSIMVFNLKSKTLRRIPIPFITFELNEYFIITQHGKSSIGLLQRIRSNLTDVWIMEAEAEAEPIWIKVASKVWAGTKRSRSCLEAQEVLGFKNKDELFIRLFNTGTLVSLNYKDNMYTSLLETKSEGSLFHFTLTMFSAYTHMPTLTLLA